MVHPTSTNSTFKHMFNIVHIRLHTYMLTPTSLTISTDVFVQQRVGLFN